MPRANSYRRAKTRARLAATGGWVCGICGKPIDPALGWYVDTDGKRKRHPLSMEADHIDPVSKSDDNSFGNFQMAHRICNQRKGNGSRPKQQAKAEGLPRSRNW